MMLKTILIAAAGVVLFMIALARADVASCYWQGTRTASGERFNPNAMTAAHRHLPFGTRIRVVEPQSKREVTVRINDRGPFVRGRTIDLSRAACIRIGLLGRGVGPVRVEVIQ